MARSRRDRVLSRLVQAAFLIGVLALWYLATARWGVSHLLLPNPVRVYDELKDVLASGEFVPDLKVTLGELAVAFAITASCSAGTVMSYNALIVRRVPAVRRFHTF